MDRWIALICGIVWIVAGGLWLFDLWQTKPWHVAACCGFLALHRIWGCTSFLGKDG